MNMAYNHYSDQDFSNEDENARGGKDKARSRKRSTEFARGRKGPAAFNGSHRRRNKRFSW